MSLLDHASAEEREVLARTGDTNVCWGKMQHTVLNVCLQIGVMERPREKLAGELSPPNIYMQMMLPVHHVRIDEYVC